MHPLLRTPIVFVLVFVLTLGLASFALSGVSAATLRPPLDSAAAMRLDGLQMAPDSAGALVYHGEVLAQTPADAPPLFRYERRVSAGANGFTATHITYDIRGAVLIAQAATVSPAYTLQRLDVDNRQTGDSGSVVVSADGRHVQYTLRQGDAVQTERETVTDPLVSGPSLHGFVLQHWDALAGGASVPVRMVVLEALRSYGFDIRKEQQDGVGQTTFSITPSSWLVRLAIAPLQVTFDTNTRHVLRYDGRVPPMLEVDGKLQTLDARVLYSDHAPRYR